LSAAPSAARRCAAWQSDGPARGRRASLAGRRRSGGGGGTLFPALRPPHHDNVAVRAPVRACGNGAGRRARCQCVAERATALKARVLHASAWNSKTVCLCSHKKWKLRYLVPALGDLLVQSFVLKFVSTFTRGVIEII